MADVYTPYPHSGDQVQFWGSEAQHTAFGYANTPKYRWQRRTTLYQDIAALERFGIDPTRPAGPGIITQANSYGYAIDGFTTGYTVKLPPPADPQAAQRTPRSGLAPSIVASSETSTEPVAAPAPSTEPAEQDPAWENPDTRARNLNAGRRALLEQDAIFAHTYGHEALHRRQAHFRDDHAGGIHHDDPWDRAF
jgi:hypothetical protein